MTLKDTFTINNEQLTDEKTTKINIRNLLTSTDMSELVEDLPYYESVDSDSIIYNLELLPIIQKDIFDNFHKFNFNYSQEKKLAMKIIELNQGYLIVENIDKFQHIDKETLILHLLDYRGLEELILKISNSFSKETQEYVLKKIINKKLFKILAKHINKLDKTDHNSVIKYYLNDEENFLSLLDYLQNFKIENHQKILSKMLNSESYNIKNRLYEIVEVLRNIDFDYLGEYLISNKMYNILIKKHQLFPKITKKYLYQKITEENNFDLIVINFSYFAEIVNEVGDDQKVLDTFISLESYTRNLVSYIKKLKNIDFYKLAKELVEKNKIIVITENFELFKNVDLLYLFMERGLYLDILINYQKFQQSIDLEKVIDEIIKKNEYWLIIQSLDKLNIKDQSDILDKLKNIISKRNLYIYLYIFEKFNKVNIEEILKDIDQSDISYLVGHSHKLKKDSQRLILNYLIENNLSEYIITYINLFETFKEIDFFKIFFENVNTNNYYVCLNYAKKFNFTTENLQLLIHKFIDIEINFDFLENIRDIDNLNYDQILQRITHVILKKSDTIDSDDFNQLEFLCSYKNIVSEKTYFNYIQAIDILHPRLIVPFIDNELPTTIDKIKKLSKEDFKQLLKMLKLTKSYKSIEILIKNLNINREQLGWSWEVLKQKVLRNINNKNFDTATNLISCARQLFVDKKNELENMEKIISNNLLEIEDLNRKKFETLNCTKEIFGYYISVLFNDKYNFEILNIELYETVNKPIKLLFNKVKEYILLAVTSEIRHYDEIDNKISLSPVIKAPSFEKSSSEEIRIFLSNTIQLFLRGFNNEASGGKPWSLISNLGLKFWENINDSDIKKMIFLLNIAVGIQHNGGYFFDKDKKRVNLEKTELTALLNFEASNNHSIQQFLNYGIENGIINKEEYNLYLNLERNCEEQMQLLPHNIDTNQIFHKFFDKKVSEKIEQILLNNDIPIEIRSFVKLSYNYQNGFKTTNNGFSYLGRLIRTMNIKWNSETNAYKKYSVGRNEIYFLSIEGYDLAFWYQDGKLLIINDIKRVQELSLEISKITNTNIVKAQFNYIKEGD